MTRLSRQPGSDESRLELLERAELLDDLTEALADAADGRGRMVLLAGEAGAGKTALLRAFCGPDLTARVLWGASERLFTPRALGPFLDIAETAAVELGGFAPNRRVPHEYLDALVAELRRASPTVLVVEDVHWADEGTLDVVKLLARRIRALPALALVSFRDDQLTATGPLQIVLGELAGTRAVERRHIPPLSLDAVRTLAEPSGVDAQQLFDKTGGQPVLRHRGAGRDRRATSPTPCATRCSRAPRILRRPRGDCWRRLRWSRRGPSCGCSKPPAARTSCSSRHAWVPECSGHENDSVSFRHELARLAVEDAIAPDRRVRLHREVLRALSTSAHGPVDPARLSHHADAAGDVEAVLRYAPAAAERAAGLCVHREAADQFARALTHGAALTPERRAAASGTPVVRELSVTSSSTPPCEARRAALALYHELGDRVREGDDRRWLSRLAWFAADRATASPRKRPLPSSCSRPSPRAASSRWRTATHLSCGCSQATSARRSSCGELAIELAERLGETEILVHALNNVGAAEVCGPFAGRGRKARAKPCARTGGRLRGARGARLHEPRVGSRLVACIRERRAPSVGRNRLLLRPRPRSLARST